MTEKKKKDELFIDIPNPLDGLADLFDFKVFDGPEKVSEQTTETPKVEDPKTVVTPENKDNGSSAKQTIEIKHLFTEFKPRRARPKSTSTSEEEGDASGDEEGPAS